MLRVGVVGLGFGEHHVRTLTNLGDVHLVAVADNVDDRRKRIADAYKAHGYSDGVEMLEKEELDAATVCVSPRFREPLLRAAGRRSVPLFVEKPWAGNLAQARRLQRIVEEMSLPVMLGFSFRFHPAVVRLRALMDGDLGAGWMANGEYVFDFLPPPEAWLWDPENGGGIFTENSCHLFDAVCSLMGEPEWVSAAGGTYVGRPSEEAAAVTIRFDGGGVAALTIGGIGARAFHEFPRLDVYTENGHAKLRGENHTWVELEWALRSESETHKFSGYPEQLGSTRYTHALRQFVDCIRSGTPSPATVADGVRSVRLAQAVYRSVRSGSPVAMSDLDVT